MVDRREKPEPKVTYQGVLKELTELEAAAKKVQDRDTDVVVRSNLLVTKTLLLLLSEIEVHGHQIHSQLMAMDD